MANFTYEALNSSGKTQKGSVEAGSQEEAIQKIKAQGLYPSNIKEAKGAAKKADDGAVSAGDAAKSRPRKGRTGKVSTKVLTTFTRQLSTLQDAGLPLLRSLQILESQQKPGKLKSTLMGVTESVEGGSSLSEAMGGYPKAFNHLYVKMVAAGEVGGVLDIILQRLAEFMEKSERLKRRIKGAMVYPIVVVGIASIILTGIMVFIIPKFEEIFKDFGVSLPGLTMWLIGTSRWFAGSRPGMFPFQGAVTFFALLFIIPILYSFIRRTKPGKSAIDWCLLKLPIFGPLVRKTVIARFTRTLGTLVAAGVPILEAIKITKDTCGNAVFERALENVHNSIREGEGFAAPLRESKTCDGLVVNMIDVGEETGELDAMLMKIADNYDEEVDVAVASLVSLLEPLMVVFLGGFVGLIVVAMFLPLVKMIQSLQGG